MGNGVVGVGGTGVFVGTGVAVGGAGVAVATGVTHVRLPPGRILITHVGSCVAVGDGKGVCVAVGTAVGVLDEIGGGVYVGRGAGVSVGAASVGASGGVVVADEAGVGVPDGAVTGAAAPARPRPDVGAGGGALSVAASLISAGESGSSAARGASAE